MKQVFIRNFLHSRNKKVGLSYVSTWSSLATAFNSRPAKRLNLSLTQSNSGLFGINELQSHDGFYLMKEEAIRISENLVKECCSPSRTRKMVAVFDELSDSLCRVADLAEFIRIAHPRSMFSHAAEDACISISGVVEKLNTDKTLYLALKRTVEIGDDFVTNEVDQHVSKLFLFDFEQCGIHLEDKKRQQVVELNDYILQLGQKFMAGAVAPRVVPSDLVPKSIKNLFFSEGDKIIVSGLYADSQNEKAREAAYKIYLHPDPHQDYLLTEMLQSRHNLAVLCGFPTFAHRALKSSIMEDPAVVAEFLEKLSAKIQPKADEDFKNMLKMKQQENPNALSLAPWDIPYLTNKAKTEWLQAGSTEFSPYFSLGSCMEGLNYLFTNLYGIRLENEELIPGEAWAPDIYKVAVIHESEGLLGHIYCDFYERTNKPNQDCHFTIQGGKKLANGSYQNPVVVLMLNLPTPRWSGPSLLTPGMVDNLFHEMGHAMHSMLARTEYQHVTGTRCSTDFAEVPSILMEYFASDPRILRLFAKHFMTNEPMPEEMLQRLCASKKLFAASEMQVQVFYSALDQQYHGTHPLQGSTTDVLAIMQNKYYSLPHIANTAWQLRFSHLVGYGAKYYSYLISKAVASWIWQSCFQADPLNRKQGEKYRRLCLAHGGGKPAQALVSDFLQLEVNANNLVNALIQDLDSK
uniref:Peptidase M3A/M3B catalytic domain-containing protein n=2 Tax=Clastoptera arizonana TaxID=38151 RepID=A0A1B6C972_9HEMI